MHTITHYYVSTKKNNTTHKSHTIPYQPITPQSTGIKIYTQTKLLFSAKIIKIICTMWVHELTMRRIINFSFLFFVFFSFISLDVLDSVVAELFNKNNNNISLPYYNHIPQHRTRRNILIVEKNYIGQNIAKIEERSFIFCCCGKFSVLLFPPRICSLSLSLSCSLSFLLNVCRKNAFADTTEKHFFYVISIL